MIRKKLTPNQARNRRNNKKQKAYRDQYYEKNREKHNEDMRRRQVMAIEAGRAKKNLDRYQKRKKEKVLNWHQKIEVDGHILFGERYAYKHKIKNLAFSTLYFYRGKRIIPKAIYIKQNGKAKPRCYLSQRQIDLINYAWRKDSKFKTLGEKSEYVHTNWQKNELGFGGDSDD